MTKGVDGRFGLPKRVRQRRRVSRERARRFVSPGRGLMAVRRMRESPPPSIE